MTWLYIVIAFIIISTFSLYFAPIGRGFLGRFQIRIILRKLAKKYGGVEIRDFLLEENHATSQIDNMLLTKKALYVIENTHFNDKISGTEESINWTRETKRKLKKQTVKGKAISNSKIKKQKFYNPIKINRTNIHKIINLIIESVHIPIYNVVVFGNRADLENISHLSKYQVINRKKLYSTIINLENSIEKEYAVLSQVDFYDALLYVNITDKSYRREFASGEKKKQRKY